MNSISCTHHYVIDPNCPVCHPRITVDFPVIGDGVELLSIPHPGSLNEASLTDALTMLRNIKADQTARAQAYIDRAGAITVDEAIKLLEGLQLETDRDTAQQLGRVVCLLLTWSEALVIKRIE